MRTSEPASPAPEPAVPAAEGSGAVSDDEGPPGSTHRFRVRVDADLADLVPGYLESRKKDVERGRDGVGRGEFDKVRIVGHSMAGSGGGYGFPGITRIGRNIERGAMAHDADQVRSAARELELYLSRMVVEVG